MDLVRLACRSFRYGYLVTDFRRCVNREGAGNNLAANKSKKCIILGKAFPVMSFTSPYFLVISSEYFLVNLVKGYNVQLNYSPEWRYEGSGIKMPEAASVELYELAEKVANRKQNVVESFKKEFGRNGDSSNYRFSLMDLRSVLDESLDDAVNYIDCFWSGLEKSKLLGVTVPNEGVINRILANHNVPLKIQLPNLIEVSIGVIDPATIISVSGDIPSYDLHAEIGRGGYGIVYKATKKTSVSSFEFALKMLDPSPFVQNYDKAFQRFSREVAALKKLQHRAIVPVIEAGITSDNKPYLVMPLIDGVHLRDATSAISLEQIIEIFIEILSGLQHAHESDDIHRDLKPSNIIVRKSDSQPIILDFGASFLLDELTHASLTTQFSGTMGYIPSEVQINPKKRSLLHDIYSCGIMLYECIGKMKPDAGNYKPLSDTDSKYRDLDAIIQRAIAGEMFRTKSADIMIGELRALI